MDRCPKITIVIPVFKVEAYIERCLKSVLEQVDDMGDYFLECILVNDCTPDNSLEIAKDVVTRFEDKRNLQVIILSHDVNRGLSVARNTGINAATGDYVLFIDSDDYLKPDSLRHFVKAVKEHPGVDMVMGNAFEMKSHSLM